MKLNPDCIRDILMSLEDVIENNGFCCDFYNEFSSSFPRLSKYGKEELEYHVRQCSLSGFFHGYSNIGFGFRLDDLTPSAHKFLANIRSDTIWSKTKTVAEKVGSKSLDAFIQISSNVITELIRSQFNLTS